MTNYQQSQQHVPSVDAYISHGWRLVPIPPGQKGPSGASSAGWSKSDNTLVSSEQLQQGWGVGLAHAYSGTMALDIDDFTRAAFELAKKGINLHELYNAEDAVIINSNRPNHGKLLYRMPNGESLPSKKLTDKDNQGNRYNYLDFRCATSNGLTTQDVLPPSIHPDTGKPYVWSGAGRWSNLPEIPASLLNFWKDLITTNKDFNIANGEGLKCSWEDIISALNFIDPNLSRDEWLHVGMALHWAGYQTDQIEQAFDVFDEWSSSAGSDKYKGRHDVKTQWKSFTPDKKYSVKIGTLFEYAKRGGWTRPKIDATHLFSQIDKPLESFESVILSLRPPPPEVDLNLFPRILATRSKEVASSVGCDPLVPLWSGLAAICGVIDTESRLELMPGFKVPPILWLMTLGNPADKKSPGSRPMLSPLKNIELEDRPRYSEELLKWEAREATYASAKKAFLEFSSDPESMLSGEEPPKVPELDNQPVPVKITVSDITSQKLVRQVADRPRGVLCYLDEMNAWVRKMVDKNSGDDRSAWVVGYEGEPYEMDRVGAGSIHADNMAVSLYGNIQPRVYRENVNNLSMDGLLQRFLPAVLRPKATKMGKPIPEFMTHASQWESTLKLTFALPASTYKLSNEAYEEFRKYQEWYECQKQDEILLNSTDEFMTAFGKLEGTAGRLALIFHVVEQPFSNVVSAELMKRVIKLIKNFIIPSLRYTLGEIGGVTAFETWLTQYIIQYADADTISMQHIKNAAKRMFKDIHPQMANHTVVTSMASLEEHKWVARIDDGTREMYGVGEWVINPELKNVFKKHREEIIKAKQRRKEDTNLAFKIYGLDKE